MRLMYDQITKIDHSYQDYECLLRKKKQMISPEHLLNLSQSKVNQTILVNDLNESDFEIEEKGLDKNETEEQD